MSVACRETLPKIGYWKLKDSVAAGRFRAETPT